MDFTRLTESDQYRQQREELRVAELELIDHVERVAALRRSLPADTVIDDYDSSLTSRHRAGVTGIPR